MKIPIGSDHAGYALKESLIKMLEARGHEAVDMGTHSTESVDYPDYAIKVAETIEKSQFSMGILICGSGQGVCMTANRFPHVRASLVWTPDVAITSRTHNDANVLCLPGRFIDEKTAEEILDIFLNTSFEGGRHIRRVEKMTQINPQQTSSKEL
jgi:ribose 5-phosphate isomerase B